ncbi:MAG: imidazole glycerol phosphate synthase subunit HisH [Candidatus Azobacteroides sp.]|nr:imidazole glycerol phosphate synthase subunit HisH [Candidatus Azobacteroides sp.]
MNIAIVQYNAGNICSVIFALKRLGVDAVLTSDLEILQKADKVIFPGVGEAKTTMEHLKLHRLDQLIRDLKQPVLGICVGMQLMCRYSEEGNTECLGIFDAPVIKFQREKAGDKIPHTGWNTLTRCRGDLLANLPEEAFVYFVHSYYVPTNDCTTSETTYIQKFSSSLQKNNFYAVQFHPEKSGRIGEKIIQNFLNI